MPSSEFKMRKEQRSHVVMKLLSEVEKKAATGGGKGVLHGISGDEDVWYSIFKKKCTKMHSSILMKCASECFIVIADMKIALTNAAEKNWPEKKENGNDNGHSIETKRGGNELWSNQNLTLNRVKDILKLVKACMNELWKRSKIRNGNSNIPNGNHRTSKKHETDLKYLQSPSKGLKILSKRLQKCTFIMDQIVDVALDIDAAESCYDTAMLLVIALLLSKIYRKEGQDACNIKMARERILKHCCSLGLKIATKSFVLASIQPILSSVSTSELVSIVMPIMTRSMLRNHEESSCSCALMLSYVSVSSNYDCRCEEFRNAFREFLATIIAASQTVNQDRRREAIDLCRRLIECIENDDSKDFSVRTLRESVLYIKGITGKAGNGMNQWFQKVGVISILGALSQYPFPSSMCEQDRYERHEIALEAIHIVIEVNRDPNDDVRSAAIAAMCAWLPQTTFPPATAIEVIDNALQAKDNIRRSTYSYLAFTSDVRSHQSSHLEAQQILLKNVTMNVKIGLTKVASRIDGLACSSTFLALLKIKDKVSKDEQAIIDSILSVDCIFQSHSYWPKLDVESCRLLLNYFFIALTKYYENEDIDRGFQERMMGIVMDIFMMHPEREVFEYCAAKLHSILQKCEYQRNERLCELCEIAILKTLHKTKKDGVHITHEQNERDNMSMVEPKSFNRAIFERRALYLFGLLLLSPSHLSVSSCSLVRLMLISQNSLFSTSIKQELWRMLLKNVFESDVKYFTQYVVENVEDIANKIIDSFDLSRTSDSYDTSGYDVIRLLVKESSCNLNHSKCVIDSLISNLRRGIDYSSHESISDDDVQIFECLEGKLAIDYAMRATMTDIDSKKKSGPLSLSTSTSSYDKNRCAAAKAAICGISSHSASTGSVKLSPQEVQYQQQLAAEAAVRKCISQSVEIWNRQLDMVKAVANGLYDLIFNSYSLSDIDTHISQLAQITSPFLVSRLKNLSEMKGSEAMSTILNLVLCLCREEGRQDVYNYKNSMLRAIEMCGALRFSHRQIVPGVVKSANKYPRSILSALIEIEKLSATLAQLNKRIPPNSFVIVLPILQYALLTPTQDIEIGNSTNCRSIAPTKIAVEILSCSLLANENENRDGSDTICTSILPISSLVTTFLDSVKIMPNLRRSVCLLLNELLMKASKSIDEKQTATISPALKSALKGLYYDSKYVRLMTLTALCNTASKNGDIDEYWDHDEINIAIYLSKHDEDNDVRELSIRLYEGLDYEVPEDYFSLLKQYMSNPSEDIRLATCKAVADAMSNDDTQELTASTISQIIELYKDKIETPTKVVSIRTRLCIARILRFAAEIIASKEKVASTTFFQVVKFIVKEGLGDNNNSVYDEFMRAGADILTQADLESCETFLVWYHQHMNSGMSALQTKVVDKIKRGSMPMLGAAATHFPKGDNRIVDVVTSMINILSTPSESVQRTVADTLVKVVGSYAVTNESAMPQLMEELMATLTGSETYGQRRGAAYGIASCCKGCGIASLKKFGVMDFLKVSVVDKKDAKKREGALLAFECLCERMGRLFEPYVIQILPAMLTAYGDGNKQVREATVGASKMIMKNLSAQGVKLILPALLNGIDDKAWRTKQGSVQMLGSMAYCAPTQLSSCLPLIVPQLSKVLGDTHPKVQQAARDALEQIGSVVRNPEVLSLVPSLLAAIADPTEHTETCLDGIMEAVFAHTIDAPSLSLLIPVISRGLRERKTESKKKAVTIVSNMCSLVGDPKDLSAYLDDLMIEMRKVLIDPIPEMRAVAAKATSMLVSGIGLDSFGELMSWLKSTLKNNENSVERSGAAQGLSEILAVLDSSHVEEIMPSIIQGCKSFSVYEREGSILMLAYLPQTLEDAFANYLDVALPCILDGLADEIDSIREVSLQAGKVFVRQFAMTSQDMLINAILSGCYNNFWRIRLSSVQLMGDLLFMVAGVTGKIQTNSEIQDDGDSVSSDMNTRSIETKLGTRRRDATLSAIYISRCDQNLQVRQSALHIWKSVVASTPRTLLEIIKELISMIIEGLASHDNEDRMTSCGGALRELVRKLGERVLPSIIPIFANKLLEGDTSTRVGVCAGLVQVVSNSSKSQIKSYLPKLMPTLRDALCDCELSVREAAGAAFGSILQLVGEGVLADVVPMLLDKLATESEEGNESADYALDGLKQIIRKHPFVLEEVLPSLTEGTLTSTKANALGALSQVAPNVISRQLKKTLIPLLDAAGLPEQDLDVQEFGDLQRSSERAASRVIEAVASQSSTIIVDIMVSFLRGEVVSRRCGAARVLALSMNVDSGVHRLAALLVSYLPKLLSACVSCFHDSDLSTLKAMWEASNSIVKNIKKDELPMYLSSVHDSISLATEHYRRRLRDTNSIEDAPRSASGNLILPALDLPRALQPLLPIYITTLLQGETSEAREEAAESMSTLISHTSFASLKPSVVAMTGPLIRIFGERCPNEVKAAVLACLKILVQCAGLSVKPFLPQLQATFLRCLHDASSKDIRERAGEALGLLMSMSSRVDPVVIEVLNSVEDNGLEKDVQNSMIYCLRHIAENAGQSISQDQLNRLCSLAFTHLAQSSTIPISQLDETMQLSSSAAACIIGLSLHHINDVDTKNQTISGIISPLGLSKNDNGVGMIPYGLSEDQYRLATSRAIAGILRYASQTIVSNQELLQKVTAVVASFLQDTSAGRDMSMTIKMSAVRAWDGLSNEFGRDLHSTNAVTASKALFKLIRKLLKDDNMQICSLVCNAIIRCTRKSRLVTDASVVQYLKESIPILATIIADNKATKPFADKVLFWCLRLDGGDSSYAVDYISESSANEKKVLTSQYITRLISAMELKSKMSSGDEDMGEL